MYLRTPRIGMDLPADVMPLVFSFLDPSSLARMAQTCRSWKSLVYRTSAWSSFLWSPKSHYTSLFCNRQGGRHIGEPHALCFLTWAHRHLLTPHDFIDLPCSFDEAESPQKNIRRVYRIWCEKKKPCLFTTHHYWKDTCIMSSKMALLRPSEIEVVRLQICDDWKKQEETRNPYMVWLQRQYDDYKYATDMYRDSWFHVETPETPLERLKTLFSERNKALLAEFKRQGRMVKYGIERSLVALRRYSQRMFDEGGRDLDLLWDGAVFSVAATC